MVKNGKDEDPPIILEAVAWKLRGGFGKYSTTVGAGPSWERRRIALSDKSLSYYAKVSKNVSDGVPRGILDISTERATITATYPGDSTQPTPYAIAIKTIDVISQNDVTKWKLCFDDRETQLLWLVALTDIVADASVKEFNGRVLTTSATESRTRHDPGGFHRLYELGGGGGRLLDLVHGALLSSGRIRGDERQHTKVDGEVIELVRRSTTREIHVMEGDDVGDREIERARRTPRRMHATEDAPLDACHDDERSGERGTMPDERTLHALAIVVASLVFEKVANMSSTLLWKTVTFVVIWNNFFRDTNKESSSVKGKTRGMDESSGETMRSAASSSNETSNFIVRSSTGDSSSESMTMSMVGTELMKFERVPLSEESSRSFDSPRTRSAVRDGSRLERHLTVDEMRAHAHERWAVSAPDVDLSGEWTLIVDDAFKHEYDAYLKKLGFSGITRRVACSLISRTTEITKQGHNGRELFLKGVNPKGAWERLITASGYPDFDTDSKQKVYSHVKTSIKTADSEDVDAEAWWEELGTKHRSWLRGGKKYGGGDFESLRYLEEGSNGSVLVCESTFHPNDDGKERAAVTWRFVRDLMRC